MRNIILIALLLMVGCEEQNRQRRVDVDRWWTWIKQERVYQQSLIDLCVERGGIPSSEWEVHMGPSSVECCWQHSTSIRVYRACAWPPPSPIITGPVEK